MAHPALAAGSTATITGGASGIGLAVACRLAAQGLNVCIADLGADRLATAAARIAAVSPNGAHAVLAQEADVASAPALATLDAAVVDRFGGTDVLMLNAGVNPPTSVLGPAENWERIVEVNLWGAIRGAHAIVPGMIARGRPGVVVATSSKQGITTPPGNPAYNVSKAGVKVFAEALAHELRQTAPAITAHLMIPGFVFTGMTAKGRSEKPAGAWTADQTADFMLDSIGRGDFYILCPDNEVPRPLDEKRILWAAQDIIENRPALSRWHPDWSERFADFVRKT